MGSCVHEAGGCIEICPPDTPYISHTARFHTTLLFQAVPAKDTPECALPCSFDVLASRLQYAGMMSSCHMFKSWRDILSVRNHGKPLEVATPLMCLFGHKAVGDVCSPSRNPARPSNICGNLNLSHQHSKHACLSLLPLPIIYPSHPACPYVQSTAYHHSLSFRPL